MKREPCRYCRHPLATVEDVHNETDEPGLCWSIVDHCDVDPEDAIDAHLATIARLERELEQEREDNEDMRDLLREVYNLAHLPVDEACIHGRALHAISAMIEDKTPPRLNEAVDPP